MASIPTHEVSLPKYKTVLLGEQNVGKTSLVTRFLYGHFYDDYQPTIGIDFMSRQMYLGSQPIRFQLWDTAGQERFRSLIPTYTRDSDIAVIVYDITDAESFKQVSNWVDDARSERGEDVIIALVGNKADLADERRVPAEDGKAKSDEYNGIFIETSAKTGFNVNKLFDELLEALKDRPRQDAHDPDRPNDGAVVELSLKKNHSGQLDKSFWSKYCNC